MNYEVFSFCSWEHQLASVLCKPGDCCFYSFWVFLWLRQFLPFLYWSILSWKLEGGPFSHLQTSLSVHLSPLWYSAFVNSSHLSFSVSRTWGRSLCCPWDPLPVLLFTGWDSCRACLVSDPSGVTVMHWLMSDLWNLLIHVYCLV